MASVILTVEQSLPSQNSTLRQADYDQGQSLCFALRLQKQEIIHDGNEIDNKNRYRVNINVI